MPATSGSIYTIKYESTDVTDSRIFNNTQSQYKLNEKDPQ